MKRIPDYTVLDMEMTGLSPKTEKVIEIGAVRVRQGKETASYSCLVKPGKKIPEEVIQLTGITEEMAAKGIDQDRAMEGLLEFLGEDILVGHNIRFDYSFLAQWCVNKKREIHCRACDTLKMARVLLPPEQSKKLEDLCIYFDVPRENAHRALDDARETGVIFEQLQDLMPDDPAYAFLTEPAALSYKAKRQTPASAHQIRMLQEYRKYFHITEELDWEGLTRSEASRIHDRYILRYGRMQQKGNR